MGVKNYILIIGFVMGWSLFSHAQMGIGTLTPDPSAALDVQAEDKGILIPRIALKALDDQTTITSGNVESLLIFNTTENQELQPGYYMWYDQQWRRLLTETDSETSYSVKIIQENYQVLPDDEILIGKPQNGNITLELPDPNGRKGKQFTVKKEDDNEDFYVNVKGNIEGIPSGGMLYTAIPHTGWKLVSDGESWRIVDKF